MVINHNLIKIAKNLLVFWGLLIFAVGLQAQENRIAIPKNLVGSSSISETQIEPELSRNSTPFSAKIVGGTTAARGEFPEFVQLFVEGAAIGQDPNFVYSWCGGSLISTYKVLTAAHCTDGLSTSDLYALPGFYSFNDNISFADLIPVFFKVEHSLYQRETAFNYDVAVLSMWRPVNGPTAKLIETKKQLLRFEATVIGTGALSEAGVSPSSLQKVKIPIVSNTDCRASYGASAITDNMLCAGLEQGTRDSCQGDSGGPLWIDVDGQRTQAGIVSWGNGCARPNFYGVYGRVSSFKDFITPHAPDAVFIEYIPAQLESVIEYLLDDSVGTIADPDLECIGGQINVDDSIVYNMVDYCRQYSNTVYHIYYKRFTFTLDELQRITINSRHATRQYTYIDLYAGTGADVKLLESNNYSNDNGRTTFLVRDLEPGDYTVIVRSKQPAPRFTLSLIGNNCDYVPLEADTMVQFDFNYDCQDVNFPYRYVRYFSFSMNTAQQISAIASSNSPKEITLYENNNGTLKKRTNGQFGAANKDAFLFPRDVSPGDYVIKVSSVIEGSTVNLRVNTIDCITSSPISLGQEKTITYSDACKNIWNRYENELVLELTQRTNTIITSNARFDYDGFDSTEVDGEHVLVWDFYPGTYKITSLTDDVNLIQTIRLEEQQCDPQSISLGDTVAVNFTGLCRLSEATYSDYRSFTLTQNTTVRITEKAEINYKRFDLYRGTGSQLTWINSGISNFGEDAVLEETLAPGTYTIKTNIGVTTVPLTLTLEKVN